MIQCESCAFLCYKYGVYECGISRKTLWVEDSFFEKIKKVFLKSKRCEWYQE